MRGIFGLPDSEIYTTEYKQYEWEVRPTSIISLAAEISS